MNWLLNGLSGRDAAKPQALGVAVAIAVLAALQPFAATAAQTTFASPEAGVGALVQAVRTDDQPALGALFGPEGSRLLNSGDAVADAQRRAHFVQSYDAANKIVLAGDKATLVIGKDQWPMPIPLVRSAAGWSFDTRQGEQEILDRRIGGNELNTIQVCKAIVDAQHEYAASHLDRDGVPVYASRLVSTPGRHDGLYWPAQSGQPRSPLGPLLAAASAEGYRNADQLQQAPYHGYLFRILDAQGEDAPGGALDYVIDGKLRGGFAVLAYPARYGASGVMTFTVDTDGTVYQKDLGADTDALAAKLAAYDPDASWAKVE